MCSCHPVTEKQDETVIETLFHIYCLVLLTSKKDPHKHLTDVNKSGMDVVWLGLRMYKLGDEAYVTPLKLLLTLAKMQKIDDDFINKFPSLL